MNLPKATMVKSYIELLIRLGCESDNMDDKVRQYQVMFACAIPLEEPSVGAACGKWHRHFVAWFFWPSPCSFMDQVLLFYQIVLFSFICKNGQAFKMILCHNEKHH